MLNEKDHALRTREQEINKLYNQIDQLKEDLNMAIRIGLTVINNDLEYHELGESQDRLETMKEKHSL